MEGAVGGKTDGTVVRWTWEHHSYGMEKSGLKRLSRQSQFVSEARLTPAAFNKGLEGSPSRRFTV
eukprot:175165-Amphidinium_carterae.2